MSDNFELPYDKVNLKAFGIIIIQKIIKFTTLRLLSSFVSENLNKLIDSIDIGCGDGRDSIYFSDKKIFTTGVDISDKVINKNKEYENEYLNFKVLDLENINSITKKFDFAYCRFLFHAISEDIENQLLEWFGENINNKIFIETRIKDTKQKVITEITIEDISKSSILLTKYRKQVLKYYLIKLQKFF